MRLTLCPVMGVLAPRVAVTGRCKAGIASAVGVVADKLVRSRRELASPEVDRLSSCSTISRLVGSGLRLVLRLAALARLRAANALAIRALADNKSRFWTWPCFRTELGSRAERIASAEERLSGCLTVSRPVGSGLRP